MYKTNFTVWLNTVRLFDFALKTWNIHIRYICYICMRYIVCILCALRYIHKWDGWSRGESREESPGFVGQDAG